MASEVDPGYAFKIAFTKVLEEPYPAGAVVSRAPKTCMFGQDALCWMRGPPKTPLVQSEQKATAIERCMIKEDELRKDGKQGDALAFFLENLCLVLI